MQRERQGDAGNLGPPDTFSSTWSLRERSPQQSEQQEAGARRISLVEALGFGDEAVLEEDGSGSEDDMTLTALQRRMAEKKANEEKQQEQQRNRRKH